MTAIRGFWFPAGSSRRIDAELSVDGDRFTVSRGEGDTMYGDFAALTVSPRVGNIPRKLTLPDRSVFETRDNDAVDHLLRRSGLDQPNSLLHQLESRWHWIGIALVAVVIVVYSSVRWGLPWISDSIARQIPQSVLHSVSGSSLELLDRFIMAPSELDADVQNNLRQRFAGLAGNPDDGSFKLHFRKMGAPNALALPNGELVVTDTFAKLATPEEFTSVMLHEIGHVEYRHGMQQLVRSSIISFVVAMVVGDPSGLEELFVALPVFLLQSSYSRQHESEADTYAFKKMMEAGIDPIHFANIMRKMDSWLRRDAADDPEDAENALKRSSKPKATKRNTDRDYDLKERHSNRPDTEEDESIVDYLSSHPATNERIERAKEYSTLFRQR